MSTNKKISQLTESNTPLQVTDNLPIERGGQNYSISGQDVLDFIDENIQTFPPGTVQGSGLYWNEETESWSESPVIYDKDTDEVTFPSSVVIGTSASTTEGGLKYHDGHVYMVDAAGTERQLDNIEGFATIVVHNNDEFILAFRTINNEYGGGGFIVLANNIVLKANTNLTEWNAGGYYTLDHSGITILGQGKQIYMNYIYIKVSSTTMNYQDVLFRNSSGTQQAAAPYTISGAVDINSRAKCFEMIYNGVAATGAFVLRNCRIYNFTRVAIINGTPATKTAFISLGTQSSMLRCSGALYMYDCLIQGASSITANPLIINQFLYDFNSLASSYNIFLSAGSETASTYINKIIITGRETYPQSTSDTPGTTIFNTDGIAYYANTEEGIDPIMKADLVTPATSLSTSYKKIRILAKNGTPDNPIYNGELSFGISGSNLLIKVKDFTGTIKTGTIALT